MITNKKKQQEKNTKKIDTMKADWLKCSFLRRFMKSEIRFLSTIRLIAANS